MHLMTQKNILQHLGLFVTSKCQESWKKKSSLCLSQTEEAPSCTMNAFGNKHWQGKVISLWLSSASGLEDAKLSHAIINTPATCTRSTPLKAMRWALVLRGHPTQWPRHLFSPPCTTHLTAAVLPSFIHVDGQLSWMSIRTKIGFPYCCLHQKLKERSHAGKNTLPWWGAGSQHPVCVLRNQWILSPGEGRWGEKMLFNSWRYLGNVCWQVTQSGGLPCRQISVWTWPA